MLMPPPLFLITIFHKDTQLKCLLENSLNELLLIHFLLYSFQSVKARNNQGFSLIWLSTPFPLLFFTHPSSMQQGGDRFNSDWDTTSKQQHSNTKALCWDSKNLAWLSQQKEGLLWRDNTLGRTKDRVQTKRWTSFTVSVWEERFSR